MHGCTCSCARRTEVATEAVAPCHAVTAMELLPESEPKKKEAVSLNRFLEFRSKKNGAVSPVTPHLRSLGPNVQRHMAYFALLDSAARDKLNPTS